MGLAHLALSEQTASVVMPVCDPVPGETAVPGPFDAGVGALLSGAGACRDVPLYGML